jgi:hypothetical protein
MTTPLTPQVRADKNGKLVTRHVKTGSNVSSASNRVPAPSLAQFRVPERDIKRPYRAAATLSAKEEAKRIRSFYGIPSAKEVADPIRMSDNEVLDYMQEGFTATAAVEFKRWGVSPEAARMSNISRLPIKETIGRMRALDLSPDEATKIIRNGMIDRFLDMYLTDNELFGLLHEEKMSSPKYHERAQGVQLLVSGFCTRDDYHELSLEQMGKYGSYLNVRRKNGGSINYDVTRAMIQKVEEPYTAIPAMRYDEGWTVRDSKLSFHSVSSLVDKYGPEILELKHMGVVRMGLTIGESLDSYRYMDEFFTAAGETKLTLNSTQRTEMQGWDSKGYSVADMAARLRAEGLAPDQTFHALANQLTLEHAKEVHLNKQAVSMMEGWL